MANTPATREQVLCSYDYIVDATVVAITDPCTYLGGVKTCPMIGDDGMKIDLHIDHVIARKDIPKFARPPGGERMEGTVQEGFVSIVPMSLDEREEWDAITLRVIRSRAAEHPDAGLDQPDNFGAFLKSVREQRAPFVASLKEHLIGSSFIFGLVFSSSAPTFSSHSWAPAERTWITDALQRAGGAGCATLRQP